MAYKKFNDFTVFDPPDVSDYLVGYRELGGEFRSTLQSVTDVVKKYATPLIGGTIFVNPSGNDSSLGNSEAFAFRTIKRGVAKALEVSRSIAKDSQDFEAINGWGTAPNPVNVFVRAGVYVEDNPIYVPPGVTVVGENLKSVTVIPKNKFYDIFWVNNKTSIQSISFKEYYSPAYAVAYPELKQLNGDPVLGYPSTRVLEATARAYSYYNLNYNKYPVTKGSKASFLSFNVDAGEPIFDPFNIAFLGRYYKNIDGNELFFTSEELVQQKEFWETKYFNLSSGVEKPYILSVPYIQNCSAATNTISANTFDAGGTVYVDGYLADGPVPSIFIQSCEHFNQGGKGIHAVNNGLAHVKDNTTTCCTEAILASDGGTCIVDDTTCSYGLSGLVSIGKSKEPTMIGTLKTDILNTDLTNKFVITNLGSTYSSENQKFPNDKKPYIGQVFQIIDQNYNLVSAGINYLSANNSGTYFVVQSASNLRPAVFPNEGYECDVIIEGTYSINSDTSITSNTFIPSLVDRLNAGSSVLFYTRSSILAYSHIFNNVGTGINYLSATIQSGAIGDDKKETNKDKVGKIFYNSQNQSGFSKFGDNVKIDQVNGRVDAITLFSQNTISNNLTAYSDINFGNFKYIDQQGGNRPLLNITRNLDDKIISIESINNIGGGNNIRSFYARGSQSLKKALSANDDIIRITAFSHNGINYPNYGSGGNSSIRFSAAGDQSSTNAGGYISLWTTKMNTISTTSERMRIADNGFVGINTTNPLSTLHVEGSLLVTDKFTVSGASTFDSITTNTLSALSAFIDVINITQYEISGFNVKGDFEIGGNTGFGTIPDPSKRLTISGNLSSKGNFDITGNVNISNSLSSDNSFFNQSRTLYSNNTDLSSYNLSATNAFLDILNANSVLFNNVVVDELSANNLFAFNSNILNLSAKELSATNILTQTLSSDSIVVNTLTSNSSFSNNSLINELSTYSLSSEQAYLKNITSLYSNILNLTANELSATNILTQSLSSDSIIVNTLSSNSSVFNTSLINELSTYSLSSDQAYFSNLTALSSKFDYSYIKKTETLYLSALSSNIYSLDVDQLKANDFYINNLNVYGLTVSYLSALSADITSTTNLNVSGVIYTTDKNSLHWNSAYSTVSALSALWSDESGDVSKLYVDTKFLTISANTYTKNLSVSLPNGKTFGRYVDGDEIPAIGKTAADILAMAIVEPIPPIVNLTSPTVIQFNQTAISNVLNYNYTIKSLAASVASLSLEYRRNNAGSWAVLGTATNTPSSFTHILTDSNFNTQPFNYRLIVTDTAGGVKTTELNITPNAYVAPTITTPSLSGNVTSPETNTAREKGNVDTNISGNITRNSTYVNLLSSQLQYQVNGTGSWLDVDLPTNTPDASYSIPWTNHNPTGSNDANSIGYRVKVTDDYTISYSNVATINFYNIIFYGSSLNAPANSNAVRALPRKIFTNGSNPFNLETGIVNTNFTVAMPSSLSITQVIDLDALNLNITTSYVLNGSLNQIQDYAGNNASYKVYTMTNSLPYTDKPVPGHRHQITRG
jgi:hypothetical protein